MVWRRRGTLVLITLFPGCYLSTPVGDTEALTEDTPEAPDEGLACDADSLQLTWAREPFLSSHASWIDLGPGGALLAERGVETTAVVRRARDGEALTRVSRFPLDEDWTRLVEVDRETAVTIVRRVENDEVVGTVAPPDVPPGWYPGVSVTLSADGATLLMMECSYAPRTTEASTSARAVTLSSDMERRVALALRCGALTLLPALEGEVLLAVGVEEQAPRDPPRPGVVRIDFETGEVVTTFPEQGEPGVVHGEAHIGEPLTLVVHAGLSEDEAELLLVLRDGLLRRLDARTLEPLESPIPVALIVAEPDSFVPRLASPAASGGGWLAFVDEQGDVLIRAPDRETTSRITLPFEPHELGPTAVGVLRFVAEGLLVATDGGTALYTCTGEAGPPQSASSLPLEVAVPPAPEVGAPVVFEVDVPDGDRPTVRWVRFGTAYPTGSLGSTVSAWASSTGLTNVEVGADDGIASALVEITVDVHPNE